MENGTILTPKEAHKIIMINGLIKDIHDQKFLMKNKDYIELMNMIIESATDWKENVEYNIEEGAGDMEDIPGVELYGNHK